MRIGKYRISCKPSSLIFPLIVLLFCVSFLIQSRDIFFDLSMVLVRFTFIAIVAIFLLVLKEEIKISTGEKADAPKTSYKLIISDRNKRIWFFIIGMCIYLFIINKIGFTISTILFTSIIMLMLGIKDKRMIVILPIGLVIFLYLIFSKWLQIPLPSGIFGF